MFGEAVVFTQAQHAEALRDRSSSSMELCSPRAWLLGAQFDALFTDNLYCRDRPQRQRCGRSHSRGPACERGYTLTFDAPTNQIFVTLDQPTRPNVWSAACSLGFTEKADDTHTVMRICTSWATTDKQVEQLIALL